MSFPGIESLSGSLFLSCGWKRSGKMSKLHSIHPENGLREIFCKKSYNPSSFWTLDKNFGMLAINCWQDQKNCTFVPTNIPNEKNFQFSLESNNFFSFTFELLVKKFKTLAEKHSTRLSKTSLYVSKRAVSWESLFWKIFSVQDFVCWGKLFPSFGRRFQKIFEIFILRVQRKKQRNFFSSLEFFSNFLAVWAIFCPLARRICRVY